jgi:hypothetical protein
MSTPQQKLRPLPVPWSVSTGVAGISMTVNESHNCNVKLVGFFLQALQAAREPADVEIVMPRIISEEPQVALRPVRVTDAYRMVQLSFSGCYYARFLPAVSDREVVDYALFDTSELPTWSWGGTPEGRVSEMQRRWLASGICTDSFAYEVADGDWLLSVNGPRWGLREFLLVGPEISIGVLANDWSWKTLGAVEGW